MYIKSRFRYFLSFIIFFSAFYSKAQNNFAPFGKVFTPQGKLRVLVIFAGFENFEEYDSDEWKANVPFPNWANEQLFYNESTDFEKYARDDKVANISKYYHEMSLGKFEMVADIFPERINIDVSNAYSFGSCNRLVIQKIKDKYPGFDWRRYDSRTNFPNFQFDNSKSAPDKKPDYVVIAYRYDANWAREPKQGMKSWVSNYSQLDGLYGLDFNGYAFDGSGFTLGATNCSKSMFKDLFFHELAHELFSCPHYSGANSAIGRYLFLPSSGSDMMDYARGYGASAFERWLLGWTEIKYDLGENSKNRTYKISDFITTGDCIRLKIPNTKNQYFWIENRQKKSVFDHNNWANLLKNQPQGSKGIADKDAGIYIYYEEVLDKRENISTGLVYDLERVNGIMPLHALGNYDYFFPEKHTLTSFDTPQEKQTYWNNKVYWFEKKRPNPLTGINPYVRYRHDLDKTGEVNNLIGRNGEFNGMADVESYPILMEKYKDTFLLTYAHIGGRNEDIYKIERPTTFVKGDKIGLGYNPTLCNRPKFDLYKDSLQPVILNGLQIKIGGLDKNGNAKLKISWNKTNINQSTRWCGNVLLRPVKNTKYSAKLAKGCNLTISRSETINCLKDYSFNFCKNSYIKLDSGAVMYIAKGAGLVIEQGQTLEISKGARCIVHKKAQLLIDPKAIIIGKIERK
jgi:M6 family metalloprotease-like protein